MDLLGLLVIYIDLPYANVSYILCLVMSGTGTRLPSRQLVIVVSVPPLFLHENISMERIQVQTGPSFVTHRLPFCGTFKGFSGLWCQSNRDR